MDEFFRNKKKNPAQGNSLLKKYPYGKIALQGVFICVSVIMLFNVVKSIVQTGYKLKILEQAEAEVEELRLENIDLVMQSQEVNEDRYIEIEARNRLNLGRDGEVQFVIPDEVLNKFDPESERFSSEITQSMQPQSTLQKWVDFFIVGI